MKYSPCQVILIFNAVAAVFCFSLSLIRVPPSPAQGIYRITGREVYNLESLSRCHQIPFQFAPGQPSRFQYFDIAQFVPDDMDPGYLQWYGVNTNPQLNPNWVFLKGITVTKVEFYTGNNCQDAIDERDGEALLRESQMKASRLQSSQMVRNPNRQMDEEIPVDMLRAQVRRRPSSQMDDEPAQDMMQAQVRRYSNDRLNQNNPAWNNNQAQRQPQAMDIDSDENDENYYPNFDIDFPDTENDPELAIGSVDQRILQPSRQEQISIEPPPNDLLESEEDELSRQVRNSLRFHQDTEDDGGVALHKDFTTLQWKEKWKSCKFSYKFNSLGQRRPIRHRDL